jgi:hypothetical protein
LSKYPSYLYDNHKSNVISNFDLSWWFNSFTNKVGRRIQEIQIEKNLSQQILAAKLPEKVCLD